MLDEKKIKALDNFKKAKERAERAKKAKELADKKLAALQKEVEEINNIYKLQLIESIMINPAAINHLKNNSSIDQTLFNQVLSLYDNTSESNEELNTNNEQI